MAPATFIFSAFVIYLYLPHIFFKFWAETSIDLGRRRDASQLEEFISAALPSAAFNLIAFGSLALGFSITGNVVPSVDWVFVRSALYPPKDSVPAFGGLAWLQTVAYPLFVYAVSGALGWLFGRSVNRLALKEGAESVAAALEDEGYVIVATRDQQVPSIDVPSPKSNANASMLELAKVACLSIVYFVFRPMYHEMFVPLFPWTVVHPYMYVRTKDKRVYHGRFLRYDKTADGTIQAIALDEVRRYCWDEKAQRYAKGDIPISDFYGTLYMKWDEIADINRVDPGAIDDLIEECVLELKLFEESAGNVAPRTEGGS